MVVSAHPDDPEFGFGATVASLVDQGKTVVYVICTDGSQGGEDPTVPDQELTSTRYTEQRAAAALLGVTEVIFLGFRDGYLEANVELRRAISREIRRFKPDLVLTHSPLRAINIPIGASHPDHLAVGEATLAAVYPDARNPRAYPELLQEGLARDFNRLMQDQRKALNLDISDRIVVRYFASPRVADAIAAEELKFGDQVPTGTYLDMAVNLPLVDPKKVLAPVLMVRGEFDGNSTNEDLLDFYTQLPNGDRQYVILPQTAHSLGFAKNRHLLFYTVRNFLQAPAALPAA